MRFLLNTVSQVFLHSSQERQTFAADNSNTVSEMKAVVIYVYVLYHRASARTRTHKSLSL